MILAALATGLVGRLDAPTLVASFNSGYGAALGEFALILIPSFVLAACLSHRSAGSAAGAATVASPFMAAGMICPDTSYAALAPVAGRRKLSVALAGYAGFKLLFPAGPLIVATGLDVDSPYLFVVGLILLGPVWLFSELWVRYRTRLRAVSFVEQGIATGSMVRALMPFGGMALLLVIGSVADLSAWSFLDFVTQPKGALAVAATAALLDAAVFGIRIWTISIVPAAAQHRGSRAGSARRWRRGRRRMPCSASPSRPLCKARCFRLHRGRIEA